MRKHNKRYENAVVEIVQSGIDEGTLRADNTAWVIAYGIIGMVAWSNRWFDPNSSAVDAQTIGTDLRRRDRRRPAHALINTSVDDGAPGYRHSVETHDVDVVVIGAGFAGLRALHTFRGLGMSVAVLEAADGIGGVWYWNRYPGARCDVESYDYSYAFSEELEQEWRWSERYATQPEILRYIEHVADRFDLRRDIHLRQRMTRAEYDEATGRWHVTTEDGAWSRPLPASWPSAICPPPRSRHLPGQDEFPGGSCTPRRWPHDGVDFTGQRVGVIGTGSSGMQMIPIIAPEVAHLTVFQRTPNFSIPAANALITRRAGRGGQARPTGSAAPRRRTRRAGWDSSRTGSRPWTRPRKSATRSTRRRGRDSGSASPWPTSTSCSTSRPTTPQPTSSAARSPNRSTDPAVREKLMPRGFPFGTKRPSVDSGYFPTFNRDNVALVDIREEPIERLDATGLHTARAHYDLDVLVYATGFDAMTGSLLRPEIVGRGGRTLAEHWAAGPRTYLGPFVRGFPNLFIVAGPGSPSLLSNVLLSIEQHVDWLAALIAHMRAPRRRHRRGDSAGRGRTGSQHVNARADATLYPKARSYYMGDDVPGKPRVFMPYSGGVRGYRRILERVVADGYEGLTMSRSCEYAPGRR